MFLHDVRPGAADKSYGIQVAKLAGVPADAIARAKSVLSRLENEQDGAAGTLSGLPLFSAQILETPPPQPSKLETAIASLDVDSLTPRAALDVLYELKAQANVTD